MVGRLELEPISQAGLVTVIPLPPFSMTTLASHFPPKLCHFSLSGIATIYYTCLENWQLMRAKSCLYYPRSLLLLPFPETRRRLCRRTAHPSSEHRMPKLIITLATSVAETIPYWPEIRAYAQRCLALVTHHHWHQAINNKNLIIVYYFTQTQLTCKTPIISLYVAIRISMQLIPYLP